MDDMDDADGGEDDETTALAAFASHLAGTLGISEADALELAPAIRAKVNPIKPITTEPKSLKPAQVRQQCTAAWQAASKNTAVARESLDKAQAKLAKMDEEMQKLTGECEGLFQSLSKAKEDEVEAFNKIQVWQNSQCQSHFCQVFLFGGATAQVDTNERVPGSYG